MLEHQRRFRLEQLAELDALIKNTAEDTVEDTAVPVPVIGTDAARREVTLKVAAAARQALADIDIALGLVAAGDYGRCRGCRTDIPMLLLRAIPTSRWCLTCRQRLTPVDGPDAGSSPENGLPAHSASRTPRGHNRRRRRRHARDTTARRRHRCTPQSVALR
ncbi:hypothetical protein ALI22I_05780 [Saccharothrix sp. ALI-22-I]|nr:hypothetical protein ALI22I_05780 [Saccharothrix sp. ALI-22-I]